MEKVNVFIADWQVLFREGIHFTLSGEEDMEVIGEGTSSEEALTFIETNQPHVAILNIDQSKLTGIEVTRRIKQNLPDVAVILTMESDNEEQLFSAMKSGASACLTKDIDPEDVVNLIRKVAQGDQPISEALLRPKIASRVVDEFEAFSTIEKQVSNLLARLLPTEAEILRHIADGSQIKEITNALALSEEIIRHHLNRLLTKLVANERSHEVIEAAQKGVPSVISKAGKPGAEYVTKDEFNEFKKKLMERFKSLIG
jgi:DNA-binding NarL/FixJ family response regulator